MDLREFCSLTRLVIVAGKGGVGKTTVTAALARVAATAGISTLVIEVEEQSGLGTLFDLPDLDYHEVTVGAPGATGIPAEVRARTLTPDDALLEYLRDHGLKRISRRLVQSGTLDVVSTAVPGIKDLLILGKVKQLERAGGGAGLIVVDAPAAGHAISFLGSARGLADAVRVGPLRSQADDVLELLGDPARCQVMLVTLPEETPVNEVVETAFALEDRVGIKLGPVVVNGLYPDDLAGPVPTSEEITTLASQVGEGLGPGDAGSLAAASEFLARRRELQQEQVARLAEQLPLPQLQLPYLFGATLGPAGVDTLADALRAAITALPRALLAGS